MRNLRSPTDSTVINRNRRRFISIAQLVYLPCCAFSSHALTPKAPSRTAMGAAMQRAAHQLLERPRVFDDPLAMTILGDEQLNSLRLNLEQYRSPVSRFLRAALVARSRFAEDELARAYAKGIRQYLLLGAGLDSFAYRNPFDDLRVFEIDHPATQAWKRQQLADAAIAVPQSLNFVAIDFEQQSLAEVLAQAKFDFNQPAFLSWLGVTMYISKAAVFQTLAVIAQQFSAGSEIVFDYSLPYTELTVTQRVTRDHLAKQVEQVNEPWISHFSTEELTAEMRKIGFKTLSPLLPTELNQRYFNERSDGFRLAGSSRFMLAATIKIHRLKLAAVA
ncbi:MAG: class I SAM-dependent methyltransferase, partial [Betaproteobacteria bacterium]